MSRTSGAMLTLLVAAAGVVLAGCASTTNPTKPPPPPSDPATTLPPIGVPPVECANDQLRIGWANPMYVRGLTGSEAVLTFTNKGTVACRTQGYPGVAILGPAGDQVFQVPRSQNGDRQLWTLAPGMSVSALLSGDASSCGAPSAVSGVLVTAPDQRVSVRLPWNTTLCFQSLSIHPLVAGDTGGLPVSG